MFYAAHKDRRGCVDDILIFKTKAGRDLACGKPEQYGVEAVSAAEIAKELREARANGGYFTRFGREYMAVQMSCPELWSDGSDPICDACLEAAYALGEIEC